MWCDSICVNSRGLMQMLMSLNCIKVINCEGIVFSRGNLFRKVILKAINFNKGNYQEHAQCNIIVQDL